MSSYEESEGTYEEDEPGFLDNLADYFDEKEEEINARKPGVCGKCARLVAMIVMAFLCLFNLLKFMAYMGCFGEPHEIKQDSTSFLWIFFVHKSYHQSMAQQFLYLAPHTAMALCLDIFLLLGLYQGRKMILYHSPWFLGLAMIYSIHKLPIITGILNLSGFPLNQILTVLLIFVVIGGFIGLMVENKRGQTYEKNNANALLFFSWLVIGIIVNLQVLAEWGLILSTGFVAPKSELEDNEGEPKGFYSFYEDSDGAKWIGMVCSFGLVCGMILYLPGAFYPQWYHDKMGDDAGPPGPAMYQLMTEVSHEAGHTIVTRPLKYLQAVGESFILMLIVTHAISIVVNPSIYHDNILKAVVGYNNLCVGFDSKPARYIAMPLQILSAYYAFRFVSLDTIRLYAQRAELTTCQFWFERIANTAFLTILVCFPLLLIITPDWANWPQTRAHFFIFVGALFSMWLRMTASLVTNYKDWAKPGFFWWGFFTFHTFGLAVVGGLDCMNAFANMPEEFVIDGQKVVIDAASGNYTAWKVAALAETAPFPVPYMPWQLCCYFDFGWFLLLGMSVVYLPHEVPLKIKYGYKDPDGPDAAPQTSGTYSTIGRAAPTIVQQVVPVSSYRMIP